MPLSDEEAASIISHFYGIRGEMSRLSTEKDDTFKVEAADARTFIFKVGHPAEPISEIDFQVRLLQHISQVAPELPVPRAFPSIGGDLLVTFTDQWQQERVARLMSYMHGNLWDGATSNASQRFKIGEILARLRHATADFIHPADSRSVAWDVKNLARLRPLLKNIDEPTQHNRLEAALDRLVPLLRRVPELRMQVLHNDFNNSNLLVDPTNPEFVIGVIDFGDAVRTAIAIDVSTAMLSLLPRDAVIEPMSDLFSNGRDFLRGYLSQADLTREELQLIPHLTMARAVARALLSTWMAKKFPENAPYLQRNAASVWAQLDWFLARSVSKVSGVLEAS
ncbi:phosphotransferase [Aquamicrobium defluvii]|nr:phosphotransferase [Aquamicrobium defluvii]